MNAWGGLHGLSERRAFRSPPALEYQARRLTPARGGTRVMFSLFWGGNLIQDLVYRSYNRVWLFQLNIVASARHDSIYTTR